MVPTGGLVNQYHDGGLIHILLVIAMTMILADVIRGDDTIGIKSQTY